MGTNPALVEIAVLCMDAPLSGARHEALVTKLSLDNALFEVDSCHHLLAYFVGSHRLHNVSELDAFTDISPLFKVSLIAL